VPDWPRGALASRDDKDLTREFSGLAAGLGDALGGQTAVLDGELVVLNEQDQPEFALMQERLCRYQQDSRSPNCRPATWCCARHPGAPVLMRP
jgi:ATP-dependent DNA ligase